MGTQYSFGSFHKVKVHDQEQFLGFLSLTILEPKAEENAEWIGQIRGSDYLVWGLNHKRVSFEFPSGENIYVIVKSGGRVTPVN